MLKEKTKITNVGGSKYFLIPESLLNDSAFPFKETRELTMEINKKEIIIKNKQ